MKVEFETADKPITSSEWHKVILSNDNNDAIDSCKFSLEICYSENTDIERKRINFRNLFHTTDLNSQKRLNVEIDELTSKAVKILGNISEVIDLIEGNFCINSTLIKKIKEDENAKKIIQESSSYELRQDDIIPVKFPDLTEEDLEDFGIFNNSPKSTSINKNNFFEEKNLKLKIKLRNLPCKLPI